MSAQRSHEELRQMGGLAEVIRDYSGHQQILHIIDARKTEVAGGFSRWFRGDGVALNPMGGGRGTDENGLPESLETTLSAETNEELGVEIDIASLTTRQQIHPFIAGQLDAKNNRINQFAVTSLQLQWDELPAEVRHDIEKKMNKGEAFWLNVALLVNLFECMYQGKHFPKNLITRPQALTAAMIWHLEDDKKMAEDDLIKWITKINQGTHGFIYAQARANKLKINNGAFTSQGELVSPQSMTPEDQAFLLRKRP